MRICNITRIALAAAAMAQAASLPDSGPSLVSPYHHYSLKLNALLTPDTPARGLFLRVRIDGGPVLRLLLDSGAQNIILDKKAAATVGRTGGAAIELVGVGASSGAARAVAPASVRIDGLEMRNCRVLAVDGKLLEGIDGVIPLSLFAGFLVRLDVPGRTLELDPYDDAQQVPQGYSPVRTDNGLLFFHSALLKDAPAGYVLLDTGATYNALSPAAAGPWSKYRSLSTPIALRGGAGDADGILLPGGLHFQVGSQILSADPAVVVDLSSLTSHHQFEVAGVLGYPALRRSIVTVDYRDSMVRFESK